MKKLYRFIFFIFLCFTVPIFGKLVSTKSYDKKIENLKYIKQIEILVLNLKSMDKKQDKIKDYQKIKNTYEEAYIFYLEGQYPSSYKRFLDTEILIERILEEISQFYIERTQDMLKDSIEKIDKQSPNDKTLIEISTDYSKLSFEDKKAKGLRSFPFPGKKRNYDEKNFHYIRDNYKIQLSVENSYKYLRESKEMRIKALKIGLDLEDHKKLSSEERKKRIGYYFDTIELCKKAKVNAIQTFRLKYPYNNYYLYNIEAKKNEKAEGESNRVYIEDHTMDFTKNKYVNYRNISPIFDNRIPAKYKIDAIDNQNLVYVHEIDEKIKFTWENKEGKKSVGLKKKLRVESQTKKESQTQQKTTEQAKEQNTQQ